MRRNTQNTISDRNFGIRQDRQGIAVTGFARSLTALLGLLCKRAHCHYRRKYHAVTVRISAGLMSSEVLRWQQPSWQPVALACPARVEAIASERS